MTRAVLSLGSNLGDPLAQLAAAVRELAPVLQALSSAYRTPPWGPVPQDDFVNLVAIVSDPETGPMDWLERCRQLERAARRERPVRWGPRTLDVDVIAVTEPAGDARAGAGVPVLSDDPELTLPHPRAAERAFVLLPWAEIEPDAELPGRGRIADLLAGLDTTGIERVGSIAR
jgi:2-amino-4-hydroxy-6-hydroxymethyldihydropteridine diphosphokinase